MLYDCRRSEKLLVKLTVNQTNQSNPTPKTDFSVDSLTVVTSSAPRAEPKWMAKRIAVAAAKASGEEEIDSEDEGKKTDAQVRNTTCSIFISYT